VCVCVCVCLEECDLETYTVRGSRAEMVCCLHKKKYDYIFQKYAIDAFLEKVSFYLHDKPTGCFHHKDGSESQVWL